MAVLYLIPKWFFGIDIGLEILFALVTLAVSSYAFRIARLSGQKEPRFFGVGFLFIGLSYLARGVINLLLVKELSGGVVSVVEFREINLLSQWSVYLYITFFTIGLISLVYMTLKTKKISFYPMVLILAVLPVFLLGPHLPVCFYILSVAILLYLDLHYLQEFRNNKNPKTRNMLVAFVLLTLASVDLSFATNNYVHYVISHVFELAAYSIVLANLIQINKNEQKKK